MSTTSTGLRTWTIRFPAPTKFLTMNDRRHWRQQAPDIKAWRWAVVAACKAAELPQNVACRVRVDVTLHFAAGRAPVRDFQNAFATAKACCDGLAPHHVRQTKAGAKVSIGYGLIPGDTDRWVEGPFLHKGETLPKRPGGPPGEVVVTVTELGKVAA